MKIFDLAIKDMTRQFRSATAWVFMFGVPLLVTGMFYFAFGNLADSDGFNLPRIQIVVANLDAGGPHFQFSAKNIPGGAGARTMGELIVAILQSDDLAELIEVTTRDSAEQARAAVDAQTAQVALVIAPDFSRQFAEPDTQAVIEFYQDPTLTIGPGIVRAILNQFLDGMAGAKIATDVFLDQAEPKELGLTGLVVRRYLDRSFVQKEDIAGALVQTRAPSNKPTPTNFLLQIVGPIMGGMMVFYAFFTGSSLAQSILREEEERTLPRLFTTPTAQAAILGGKFLAVFLTVLVQVVTLIVVARFLFGIEWGAFDAMALAAGGVVCIAASFGILLNSFMKSTKQGGTVFGGVLTMTGMLGMISIFAMDSPTAAQLSETAALLVPQGWAIRGVLQAMNGAPLAEIAGTTAVMLGLSAVFFAVGAWRFNRRYA